jgi:hypothetical protein
VLGQPIPSIACLTSRRQGRTLRWLEHPIVSPPLESSSDLWASLLRVIHSPHRSLCFYLLGSGLARSIKLQTKLWFPHGRTPIQLAGPPPHSGGSPSRPPPHPCASEAPCGPSTFRHSGIVQPIFVTQRPELASACTFSVPPLAKSTIVFQRSPPHCLRPHSAFPTTLRSRAPIKRSPIGFAHAQTAETERTKFHRRAVWLVLAARFRSATDQRTDDGLGAY